MERRLHQQPRHPGYVGRPHPGRRTRVRWRRPAGAGRDAGNLAGRCAGTFFQIRKTSARCRIRASRVSVAAAPIPMAVLSSTPSSRAPCQILTASRRHRICCSRSSRAACCCKLYTRIYLGGEAANAADPVLALVPADRRSTLIAAARAGRGKCGLSFRYPFAGRQRNGVFRYLACSVGPRLACLERSRVKLARSR